MNKRRKILILMLTMISLFCISCGRRQEETVEITVIHAWGSTESDHVSMRAIFEDFQQYNPNVRIRLISMPTGTEMIRKVEDMLLVGDIPDVISFGGTGSNSTYDFMVENNLALDIFPYLNADETFRNSIADSNLEYWITEENKLYTLSDVLLLSGGYWYNEEIFSRAGIEALPETWAEYVEMCRKIAAWSAAENSGIKPLQPSGESYLYLFDHLLASNGGETAQAIAEKRISYNEQEMKASLDLLKPLYDISTGSEDNYSYRDETDLFNEGKIAMYINGVWGAAMIEKDINAKYALMPSLDGKRISCISSELHYVLGNTRNKEREDASVQFLKYMMSEEVQKRVLTETGQVPANPNIALSDYEEDMPRFYQAVMPVNDAQYKIETPGNLWKIEKKDNFVNNIMDMLSGKMTEADFIELIK